MVYLEKSLAQISFWKRNPTLPNQETEIGTGSVGGSAKAGYNIMNQP